MTKIYLTEKQQAQLNVQAVSDKAITYTDEFKRHFIAENEKGKLSLSTYGKSYERTSHMSK